MTAATFRARRTAAPTAAPTAANDAAQPEPPEHRGQWRRFIVWSVLAGYASHRRLVERIVREIESESQC